MFNDEVINLIIETQKVFVRENMSNELFTESMNLFLSMFEKQIGNDALDCCNIIYDLFSFNWKSMSNDASLDFCNLYKNDIDTFGKNIADELYGSITFDYGTSDYVNESLQRCIKYIVSATPTLGYFMWQNDEIVALYGDEYNNLIVTTELYNVVKKEFGEF